MKNRQRQTVGTRKKSRKRRCVIGYTHYWENDKVLTQDERDGIEEDIRAIIAATDVPLLDWDGLLGRPSVRVGGDQCVSLNGRAEDGRETFTFPGKSGFNFCKTAYKPYDVVVTAILIAAENRAPQAFGYNSDGEHADWEAGLELAERATGRELGIRFS